MKKQKITKKVTAIITGLAMLFAAGMTVSADTDTDKAPEVWEIPQAGMDITLPESWTESGFYMDYRPIELVPEIIITSAVMYDVTEDELMAKGEELGDSEALSAYVDEHINDMFILLSVSDQLSEEDLDGILAEASENASFDRTELGKADGWTFYEISGDEIVRRTDPEAETGETMKKILEDLPELYNNIRFYQPEKEPRIEPGTKLSFKTTDFEGNDVDSADLFAENTYTMVNIWTSWCTFCVEEMPELEKMNAEFAEENCGIIGVMMDGDEEEALEEGKRIAEETGVTYPLLIPTEDMKGQLIATAYPTTVFADSEGVVASEPIKGMDVDLYRQTMEELLAGTGTEETGNEEAAGEAQGYCILVQDENGDPVPEVVVQFCSDSECMMDTTGEDGTAVYDVEAGAYTVHILKAPEGYEKDDQEYQAPEEPGTLVITLKAE